MHNKSLLVLAASLYQLDAIKTAKRLGYRVVSTDNVPANPGHAIADVSYTVNTTDKDGVLEIARKEDVDGVIAPATDVAMPTLAHVAEQLGLPGPSPESVEIVCDKLNFRAFLKQHGFPVPQSRSIGAQRHPDAAFFDKGPCILKPDRSSGSKGIFIVASQQEYRERLPETLSFSPTGKAILERFIAGTQGTVEGILKEGDLALTFFLDRQTFVPPYVTTCGHRLPSRLPRHLQQRVKEQLREVWHLLNIVEGPFDCDFVTTDDEAFLLEASPRLGGNSISRLLRYAAQFDIVEYSIKCACGDPAQLPPAIDIMPTAVALFGVATAGSLSYDPAQAQALQAESWVDSLSFDAMIGQAVQPFKNGRYRLGEAFMHGRDRDELDARVAEFTQRLALKVDLQ